MVRLASILVYVKLRWLEKRTRSTWAACPGHPARPQGIPLPAELLLCRQPRELESASKPLQYKLGKDGWITASQQPVLSLGNWALCLLPQWASGYRQHSLPPQPSEGAGLPGFPPAFLQGR